MSDWLDRVPWWIFWPAWILLVVQAARRLIGSISELRKSHRARRDGTR